MNSLANCLLKIDDSCEEIDSDKNFVKMTTPGRHKNINVIMVYFCYKWSRTIGLNTTNIFLIKLSSDIQQVNFLGKQLNIVKFFQPCYQLATKELFRHLLIDLDPKTSDCLRYCSNITEPVPKVFYLTSDKEETNPLNNETEKKVYNEANGAFATKRVEEIFAQQ